MRRIRSFGMAGYTVLPRRYMKKTSNRGSLLTLRHGRRVCSIQGPAFLVPFVHKHGPFHLTESCVGGMGCIQGDGLQTGNI